MCGQIVLMCYYKKGGIRIETYTRCTGNAASIKLLQRGSYEDGLKFLARHAENVQLFEPFITMQSWKDENFKPHVSYSSFAKVGNVSYLVKSYFKDRVIVGFSEKNDEVEIFGDQEAQKKVLLDLIISDNVISPLHGSVVAKKGKATAIIGNSHMGKSGLSILALASGYDFLSDDLVICDRNFVYCCLIPINFDTEHLPMNSTLQGNTLDPVHLTKYFGVSIEDKAVIHNCIVLTDEKWRGLSSLKRPFPAGKMNSYWGTNVMFQDWRDRLDEMRRTTYEFWDNLLASAKILEFFDVKSSAMRNRFLEVLNNGY